MAIFRNQQKPKSFNIPTLHWDPEKEERVAREKRIKAELGITSENSEGKTYVSNIKGQFRSAAHGDRSELKNRKQKEIRRMFLYGAILLVIVYFLFSGLPVIEEILKQFAE